MENVESQTSQAVVSNVDFKSISRDSVLFHAEVSVDNPYSHRLPICKLSYTLKNGDRKVASRIMPDPGWIEASVLTKLELPVKIPSNLLISLARDLGRVWGIKYIVDIGHHRFA